MRYAVRLAFLPRREKGEAPDAGATVSMIPELFTYMRTPCPKYVRKMGYLREAIAIEARRRRCSQHWAGHLENTKSAVCRAIQLCGKKRKVVVLGSGPLLDLPVEVLAAAFEEVVLVDIVHLLSATRTVRRYGNVRLVSADITGIARKLFHAAQTGESDLPEPAALFPGRDNKTDLVISLNILSQLPVIPKEYALKKLPWINEAVLEAWGQRIMANHYDSLRGLPCSVCLITDYAVIVRDEKGGAGEQSPTLGDIRLPWTGESWTWDITPRGEASRLFSEHREVAAVFMNLPAVI